MDICDLKEGQDKYAYMERMVADPEVTHVLVFSDKSYAEKANARQKGGVGTESQIISKEVYEKAHQSKFIPIVCEFQENGDPYLPTFLASRKWIDFSSPEAVNSHWEQLVRRLYGKPLYEKPALGKPPPYVTDPGSVPSTPARAKFATFRQAILQGKPGVQLYRSDFLNACLTFVDALRIRKRPGLDDFGQKVLEDCGKLLAVRDLIVDWVLLEAQTSPSQAFSDALLDTLEQLRQLKARPAEVTAWHDIWFEAHQLFAYETFLYIIAALLKARAYQDLHTIYTAHYMRPDSERHPDVPFDRFDSFYAHSEVLNSVLAEQGEQLLSPTAALVKRQATRSDLPFQDLIQADLLTLMMAFITPDTRWYPQLMHYARYSAQFPFFTRAADHGWFQRLAIITGIADADTLRTAVENGHKRLGVDRWSAFRWERNFATAMNLKKLDSLT